MNKIKHELYLSNRNSLQEEQQLKYSKEIKNYKLLESIDDITLFVDKDKNNLIIQYNNLYTKYNKISRKEYNDFFKIGLNYDSNLKETIYSNNTSEYTIISSSFYTYVALDENTGFIVYTYKPFEDDRKLKEVYDNYYLLDETKIKFGEELNHMLYKLEVVEPFIKNKIVRDNDVISVIGDTKDYRWNIVKDDNYEFTLKGDELNLKSANFSDSGEYIIKLEKKQFNSYISCSNTIIVKID